MAQTFFMIIYLALCAQLFSGFLIYSEQAYLEDEDTKHRFGSIYQGLRLKDKKAALMPAIFFFRRVMFIVCLESDTFAVKFGGSVLCSMCMLCYTIDTRPYADKGLAVQEFLNEVCLLGLLYFLPAFSPFIPSLSANYRFGWAFIYTMGPFLAVNVIFIIIGAIQLCISTHRKMRLRRLFDNAVKFKTEAAVMKVLKKKSQNEGKPVRTFTQKNKTELK